MIAIGLLALTLLQDGQSTIPPEVRSAIAECRRLRRRHQQLLRDLCEILSWLGAPDPARMELPAGLTPMPAGMSGGGGRAGSRRKATASADIASD